jgi:hypothetical protein
MRVKMFIRFNSDPFKIAWGMEIRFYSIACEWPEQSQWYKQ